MTPFKMILTINFLITSYFLISFESAVCGQTDSIHKLQLFDSISNFRSQEQKLNYLNVNLRKETLLFKAGAIPLFIFAANRNIFATGITSTFSFEKKIAPSFSVNLNYDFNYTYLWQSEQQSFDYSIDFGIRYYYLMKKRIRESIGANNFHSNYFSISFDNCVKYYNTEWLTRLNQNGGALFSHNQQHIGWNFKPLLDISWGLQRRIGKYLVIDAGPYCAFNKDDFELGLNILFGLGLGH